MSLTAILSVGERNEFICIEEIASDDRGNIYVTDAYRFDIKKFSPAGALIKEYGKRGSDPADFSSPPYKIACNGNNIAVAVKGSSRIQIFDEIFILRNHIDLPGIITDLIFDRRGRIIAGLIPFDRREGGLICVLDKTGTIIGSTRFNINVKNPLSGMLHVCAGSSNCIVAACRFSNRITIFSERLKPVKQFSLPGLLQEAPSAETAYGEIGRIPEGDLIKDIATDARGNIYILSGDFDDIPNRIVYLFNRDGILLERFRLPDKSGIIYIDKNENLYTRENRRAILKKYAIRHNMTGEVRP